MPTYFTSDRGTVILANRKAGASLVIHSDPIPAAEISRRLGINPDRSWRRGDKMGRGVSGHRHRTHGWAVESGLDEDASVNEHLAALLTRLSPAAEALRTIASTEGIKCKLWLVEHIENWNPGISLSPEEVDAVARTGAELDIDIYVYEPGELAPIQIPRRVGPEGA